jgi:hypothetical protein
MSQEFDDVTHAFAELLSKLQSANDNDKQAAIIVAIDSLLMALGSLEHRLDTIERSNGITRGDASPRAPKQSLVWVRKPAAVVAPGGCRDKTAARYLPVRRSRLCGFGHRPGKAGRRAEMALFYACQSAEAERDVALAVKAEPAVEYATS